MPVTAATELRELCNRGELGKLLEKRFSGTRECDNPCEDQNFAVSILAEKPEQKLPTIEDIKKAIADHYGRLGYTVEDQGSNAFCIDALITRRSDRCDGFAAVIIAVNSPSPQYMRMHAMCHILE